MQGLSPYYILSNIHSTNFSLLTLRAFDSLDNFTRFKL